MMTNNELMFLAIGILGLFTFAMYLKEKVINEFKIDHYERLLKSKDVDISHIENATFTQALD